MSELFPARFRAHTHTFSSAVSLHCAGASSEISTDLALLNDFLHGCDFGISPGPVLPGIICQANEMLHFWKVLNIVLHLTWSPGMFPLSSNLLLHQLLLKHAVEQATWIHNHKVEKTTLKHFSGQTCPLPPRDLDWIYRTRERGRLPVGLHPIPPWPWTCRLRCPCLPYLPVCQLSSVPAHPLKITPKIDAADSEAALDKTGEPSVKERQEV